MKKLAMLLGQAESEVNKLVDKLEAKTGFESMDVSFLASHHLNVRRAIASLGLDPDDTTGPELYQTLQAKFDNDSSLFDKSLGITEPLSSVEKMNRVQTLVSLGSGVPETWAIKTSALKAIFRELSPTKTVRQLGFRSVESMLKRQDLGVMIHVARHTESSTWRTKFSKALAKNGPSLYEVRPVKFLVTNKLNGVKAEPVTGTLLFGSSDLGGHSMLSLSLAAFHELEKISRANSQSLSKTTPALAWWQKLEHLAAIKDDRTVSFNIKDVAYNWRNKLSYFEQVSSHAAERIMQSLLNTYDAKTNWAIEEAEVEQMPASEVNQLAKEIVEV